jgi:hypothetical protein
LFAWEASRIQNKLALPVRSTRAAHESAIAQKLLNFMGLSLVYTEFIVDIIRKNKRNYMDLPAGFALPPAIQMQRATRSGGARRPVMAMTVAKRAVAKRLRVPFPAGTRPARRAA